MFRPSLIAACRGAPSAALQPSSLIRHCRPAQPIRSYSQPPQPTTFNRTKPGQTAARAPRPSATSNVITFLAVSSIGVGAYLYQWDRDREGSILNPLSSSELCAEKWTPILLTNVTRITDQASLFEFQLPKPCVIPISSAVYVKDDEIQTMRAYTPVHSTEKEQDRIQFLIKRYEGGQVSRFIHSAQPGKRIEMRGPILIWPGGRHELEKWDEIGMVKLGHDVVAPDWRRSRLRRYGNVDLNSHLTHVHLDCWRNWNHGHDANHPFCIDQPGQED